MNPTPGPWRFEVNLSNKVVELCGGNKPFDVTVMTFARFGMDSAAPCFNADIRDDYNEMKRADSFAVVVPGNEKRAGWFRRIDHPDARLIEAAPTMYEFIRHLSEEGNADAAKIIEAISRLIGPT